MVFVIILGNTLLSIQCQNMTWTNFYVFQTCSTITLVTEMFDILKNNFNKIQIQVFFLCKLCLNIFTPSSNYICSGPDSLSSYIDTSEIAGWKQTPKWDHFLPLIGCTSQDKINVFQLTYLSLPSLLSERHWSSHLGLHIISVSNTRKNTYRSDIQVTFDLYSHFRCLQIFYSKWNYIN